MEAGDLLGMAWRVKAYKGVVDRHAARVAEHINNGRFEKNTAPGPLHHRATQVFERARLARERFADRVVQRYGESGRDYIEATSRASDDAARSLIKAVPTNIKEQTIEKVYKACAQESAQLAFARAAEFCLPTYNSQPRM